MSLYEFPKSHRLTDKKKFERLFKEGKSVKAYPLRLIFIHDKENTSNIPYQMAFSVPKRKFKKAVHRNLLKRRMKEAFRLNKNELIPAIPQDNNLFFGILIYMANEAMPYDQIEKAMKKVLTKTNAF